MCPSSYGNCGVTKFLSTVNIKPVDQFLILVEIASIELLCMHNTQVDKLYR